MREPAYLACEDSRGVRVDSRVPDLRGCHRGGFGAGRSRPPCRRARRAAQPVRGGLADAAGAAGDQDGLAGHETESVPLIIVCPLAKRRPMGPSSSAVSFNGRS